MIHQNSPCDNSRQNDFSRPKDFSQKKSLLNPLRVEKLRKQMGEFILEADFFVEVGERAVLSGKSGGGKTTLLRILAGLEPVIAPVDQGRVRLGDQDITYLAPQKRDIGLVFQDQALFSGWTVLDNVTFGLRMRGISRVERDSQALAWLDKVGLKARARSPVEQLSGGEKQRVAFLRALIWKPKLLLLDEPFSALDGEMRQVLRKELIELHQLWPAPLILVTHDEADLQALATVQLDLSWEKNLPMRKVSRLLTSPTVCD